MWTYDVISGMFSHNGQAFGAGYSGQGEGYNNPYKDHIADVGPIPAGKYTIGAFFDDPGGKGPLVAHLTPDPANEMHGRAGFMIHGDNAAMNHTASHGCIIAAHVIRRAIADSGDTALEVF